MSIPQDVYGDGAAEQTARYDAARRAFEEIYGRGEVYYFRAPGRVNLIGEHTDYNHGFVLPVALDKDTLLLARPRADTLVRLCNVEPDYPPVTFAAGPAISSAPPGDWGNYARGAAQRLAQHFGRELRGLDGLVVGAPPYGVPRGAGLSSSSALVVAVAVALAHWNVGAGLSASADKPGDTDANHARMADLSDAKPAPTLDGMTLAQLCSEAEWYVGTRGGVMDHFIAVLGRRDHALFLDCRPDAAGRYRTEYVPLPAGYRILVVDSGVHHRNVGGAYNQRVAACRAGVALLRARYAGITHLRDVQDVPWGGLAAELPEEIAVAVLLARGIELGDLPGVNPDTVLQVRARCRHVWTENRRVIEAVAALRAGDTAALGRLLDAAHASVRDDYEVSCPEIECLVRAGREVDGVAGTRLTGAGWGGCIVALVRNDAVPAFEAHVTGRYRAETGRNASFFACRAGPGAGLVSVSRA